MRAWNTETRNEQGVYYRKGDWSVDAARVEGKANFTTIAPPQEAIDGCACDWIDGKWVLEAAALAAAKVAARAARYKAEADPFMLAYFGYEIEKSTGKDVAEKQAKAKADYLAAKAKIRSEIPDA